MRVSPVLLSSLLLANTLPLTAAVPSTCRPMKSFEQGHELRQSQMMAAYNAPARIEVRGSWDLYFDASYIFWQPMEDNLELGIANSSSLVQLPINGQVADVNFKYKSGVKAGIGIFSEQDNWDAHIEYTFLTGRHSVHSSPTDGGIIPFWGHPANVPNPSTTKIPSGKGLWRLETQFLDVNLGRSSYVGTKLTLRPYFGARGAWIDQKYKATYNTVLISDSSASSYQIRQTTTSWGLGPEVGVDSSWLLGYGIRIVGLAEADLLFTRYNLRYKEQNSIDPSGTPAASFSQRHVYYLRPHLNLEMGFGWGTYFCNHNYHFDLQATYGFQVFWDQNMFRKFYDDASVGISSVSNGNLYMQGLTASVRFDF